MDEALTAIDLVGACHGPDCPCSEAFEAMRPGCREVTAERSARVREVTERFRSTGQLVELGLMRTSPALDALAGPLSHKLPGWAATIEAA